MFISQAHSACFYTDNRILGKSLAVPCETVSDVPRIILQETFSVIGDPATAMRDPVFYRLHSFVDDIFQEHKATLPRYDTNRVSGGCCYVAHYPRSTSDSVAIQGNCTLQENLV
jgi:hypothetical protein